MTPEKYTKLKAHEYIMRFQNLGIPLKKAQDAANLLVMALCDQWLKTNKNASPELRQKALQNFETLISNINAYLPGRDYITIPIEEIAALKGCKKSQVLITY